MSNHEFDQAGCDLKIDQAATYCIRVAGYLDESWSARLGGLEIAPSEPREKQSVTTLSGSLIDQAALFGVLKALYDMRLPLISVEYMASNCKQHPSSGYRIQSTIS